jgi:hypothetical protein|tara:strand:+ start:9020 stop:9805 length:786 start_codon:yes stop_codon:yes gene_type:complete
LAKAPVLPDSKGNPESDAFLREVDDAYRQDRMSSFWQRYGRWLLIAIGAVLIALAGVLWWQQEQAAERGRNAEAFDQAIRGLDLGDPEARSEIERFAASDINGYSSLARLVEAGLLAEDGEIEGAVENYRAVAADVSVEQPLRDLATVQAARLSFDTVEPETLMADLAPLATEDSAWFGVAGELLAAAHLKAGDTAKARDLYVAMAASETIPPSLRGRMSQLAAMLGGSDGGATLESEAAPDEPIADGDAVTPTQQQEPAE